MEMINGFKAFLLRGNVIDLAVAFVLGLAFAAVITSLVTNILTPIIALIFGEPSLASLDLEISDTFFRYGAFLDSVITFVLIAFALYFFVVIPYNKFAAGDPKTKTCPHCQSSVDVAATRCAFCTSELSAAA